MTIRIVLFLIISSGALVERAEPVAPAADAVAAPAVEAVAAPAPKAVVPPAADSALVWTDPASRLVWQRGAAERAMPWKAAVEYCATNSGELPGAGWRLPTIDELKALLVDDETRRCRWPSELSGSCGIYWTSSEGKSKSDAHYADFNEGLVDFDDKGFDYQVRCVRK
jgi:hypothetical protein